MRTIAFYHQKGGTGKTTLAVAAATALAAAGERVLLLDTDPQGTAAEWGGRYGDRCGIAVRAQSGEGLGGVVSRLAAHFDWCLIDCAPTVGETTLAVLALAEGLVVPLRPAPPDIWALERVGTLVSDRRCHGPLAVRLVINQHRGEDLGPVRKAAEELGFALFSRSLPEDPAWATLFGGMPLPTPLLEPVGALLRELVRDTGKGSSV